MKRTRVNPVNRERRAKNFVLAYGSEERVQWMHTFPCEVDQWNICRWHWPEVAHTIAKQPNGRGGPDDTVTLCAFHHRQLHSMGKATFEGYHGFSLTAAAARYAKLWNEREKGLEA